MFCLHVLALFDVKQILALHALLKQRSVLQHHGLDLAEQVAVLLLQVALQLAQQLNITQTDMQMCNTCAKHTRIRIAHTGKRV